MIDSDRSERAPSDDRDTVSSPRRRVLQGIATGGVIAAIPSLEAIHGRLDDEPGSDEGGSESGDDDRLVTSVAEARDAVVRIDTERTGGEYGDEPIPVSGSGFVVDPSGIVVTNGHVVTGVDSFELSVDRGRASPDSTVLGTVECADLAVLGIEGEGYAFLPWYDGEPEHGLDVWALGFPDGESYATTDGAVSETGEAANEWVAVDSEIRHTAPLRGGHSGGPLVDAEGRVVGVNYAAGNPLTPAEVTEQFAIGSTVASDVAADVRAGTRSSSIGIHGVAVPTEDRSPAGIRVTAVESDSSAGEAGVRPGDVITAIGNTYVGIDVTVREYCDAVAAHDPAGELPLRVYRDGVVLAGRLDSRPLEPVLSLPDLALERSDEPYREYVAVTDETGMIWVDAPAEWTDREYQRTDIGPSLVVTPDLDGFRETFETPGLWIQFASKPEFDADELLSDPRQHHWTATEPVPYDDGLYTGVARLLTDRNDHQSSTLAVAAEPRDRSFALAAAVHLVADRDRAALDRVLAAFHHRDAMEPAADAATSARVPVAGRSVATRYRSRPISRDRTGRASGMACRRSR